MIVLHHYPTSPWAETVRLILGLKGLDWHSVEVPAIMPKPDLVALTGGYARVPVLQIGADFYCDTAAIADALEAVVTEPTLFPEGDDQRGLAAGAQGPIFLAAVGTALVGMPREGMEAFWEDRAQRFGMHADQLTDMAPVLTQQFESHLDSLEARLADGRPWLGGHAPGHADFAHYQLLWFQDRVGEGSDRHTWDRPGLRAWMVRVATIGHGRPTPMTAMEALALARRATAAAREAAVDPASGFTPGQTVAVSQTGSTDPAVIGTLLALDTSGITLRRDTPETGTVHVHFPRAGQEIRLA